MIVVFLMAQVLGHLLGQRAGKVTSLRQLADQVHHAQLNDRPRGKSLHLNREPAN